MKTKYKDSYSLGSTVVVIFELKLVTNFEMKPLWTIGFPEAKAQTTWYKNIILFLKKSKEMNTFLVKIILLLRQWVTWDDHSLTIWAPKVKMSFSISFFSSTLKPDGQITRGS